MRSSRMMAVDMVVVAQIRWTRLKHPSDARRTSCGLPGSGCGLQRSVQVFLSQDRSVSHRSDLAGDSVLTGQMHGDPTVVSTESTSGLRPPFDCTEPFEVGQAAHGMTIAHGFFLNAAV